MNRIKRVIAVMTAVSLLVIPAKITLAETEVPFSVVLKATQTEVPFSVILKAIEVPFSVVMK